MKNIILDFDSTLVTIEGVDELARQKGMLKKINNLTMQAMNGNVDLEKIFAKRLNIIQPTQTELNALSLLYLKNITPGAKEFIAWATKKFNIFIVTSSFKNAVLSTVKILGVAEDHLFANQLLFDNQGRYQDFNQQIPLWQTAGKAVIVKKIQQQFPEETLIIGDGISDAQAKTNHAYFVQFKAVINRPTVSQYADAGLDSFSIKQINAIMLRLFAKKN